MPQAALAVHTGRPVPVSVKEPVRCGTRIERTRTRIANQRDGVAIARHRTHAREILDMGAAAGARKRAGVRKADAVLRPASDSARGTARQPLWSARCS